MPRRRDVPKRKILPDPKYKDKLVAKFTNSLMIGGKKAVAEGILYGAFDHETVRMVERMEGIAAAEGRSTLGLRVFAGERWHDDTLRRSTRRIFARRIRQNGLLRVRSRTNIRIDRIDARRFDLY